MEKQTPIISFLKAPKRLFFIGMVLILALFLANLNFNKKLNLNGASTTTEGQIDDVAATHFRGDSATENVAGASTQRADTQIWVATDYKSGDIKQGNYVVKRGDTLWEIAEAVYGDGTQWHKILEANKNSIGYLPNGAQALIVENQTLNIP